MFPLGAVLFPHASMPLHVFEPRYRALMRDCLAGDHRFGVVLIARGSEVGGGDERTTLGTRGVITEAIELADGRWVLEVQGEARIEVTNGSPTTPTPWRSSRSTSPGTGRTSLVRCPRPRTRAPPWRRPSSGCAGPGRCWPSTAGRPPLPPELAFDDGDTEVASWQLCAVAPVSAYDAQRLLAADGAAQRLGLLVELMTELELDLHRMLRAE